MIYEQYNFIEEQVTVISLYIISALLSIPRTFLFKMKQESTKKSLMGAHPYYYYEKRPMKIEDNTILRSMKYRIINLQNRGEVFEKCVKLIQILRKKSRVINSN